MTRLETLKFYAELAQITLGPILLLAIVLGGFWSLIGAPLLLVTPH